MSSYTIDQATFKEMIQTLEASFYEIAILCLLWGLHIALACYAIYLLWKRGLRKSLPRQCLSGIVIIMLATSTAHAILQTRFYLIQFPTLLDPKATPALLSQLSKYDIAASWMSRLNYCLSDLIVIWRAWALWPGSRPVRWTLGIAMSITAVCTTANATMTTVQNLQVTPDSRSGPLYPDSALRALLYIPLIATNILATFLICFKAWVYRKEIQSFTTRSSNQGVISLAYSSSFRVGRILALFIETGALYIVLMTINAVRAFGVFSSTVEGLAFGLVWTDVITEIAAIYPTIIIIFVSKFMSQENAVYSSAAYKDKGSLQENIRPDHDQRVTGNGMLSTIRFEMHRATVTCEDGDQSKSREFANV